MYNNIKSVLCLLLFVPVISCGTTLKQESKATFTSTDDYKTLYIKGFKVLLSPEVYAENNSLEKIKQRLNNQIEDIKRSVPKEKFNFLVNTPIWVEYNVKDNGFIEYHPSKNWLTENGYNPEKAKSLEISNVKNYLEWSKDDFQPSILLHELAHALYHSLSKEQKRIIKAQYEKTLSSGLYRNVTRKLKDKKEDAYALEDHWEYFAELSESYFGENEYFPFNKKMLKDYDPVGYELVEKIWL